MLYAFGVGEVRDQHQRRPARRAHFVHTVRDVGAVSGAIASSKPARRSACAVRSAPAGRSKRPRAATLSSWPAASASRRCARRSTMSSPTAAAIGRVVILFGSRNPADMLYRHELEQWRRRLDVDIEVTVDHADADWHGNVGVVPTLIPRAAFDPHDTVAHDLRPGSDDALHRERAARCGRCQPTASICRWSAT